MRYSAVLIVPADLKPQADTLGAAMGWGDESYTIPIIASGEAPTHYALRADVTEQFVRWIKGLDPLPVAGAEPVMEALIWDFSPDPTIEAPEDDETYAAPPVLWGRKHLDYVIQKYFKNEETE
jgi:hypothetical protein